MATMVAWGNRYRVPVFFADNRVVARAIVKMALRLAVKDVG